MQDNLDTCPLRFQLEYKTWPHRLSCLSRAAGYRLSRRVRPRSPTTGPPCGSPRSLFSSSSSVPSSRYALERSSFSRIIPNRSASTWAWRTCWYRTLNPGRKASTVAAKWSSMAREDTMSTDTSKTLLSLVLHVGILRSYMWWWIREPQQSFF